jgi:hypothetical protein
MTKSALLPTDYASLSAQMNTLFEQLPLGDFSACITSLLTMMREQFPSLTQEFNPVVTNLRFWTPSQLKFIIEEYSGFSNAAIHMFLEARIRNRWSALTNEIIRNMDEEMGALTKGIPHLELMRDGYRSDLGIETDGLEHTEMTKDFISRMNVLFRYRDNTFLAGVLLAFETTAVEEFRVVEHMLRRYKEMIGGEITMDSFTGQYIAGHVVPGVPDPQHDPEMDHYRGMVEAVGANVVQGNLRPIVQGFFSVCLELNRWWEQVALEALQKTIREQLLQHRGESPDVNPHYRVHGTSEIDAPKQSVRKARTHRRISFAPVA